jgi:hypothetical protein
VEYFEVRPPPDDFDKIHTCIVCSLNTQDKREADLDLNFVAGKRDISIYFQNNDSNCVVLSVNLSGYVVGGRINH